MDFVRQLSCESRSLLVDLVLKRARAYIDGQILECNLAIEDGRIFKIGKETGMPRSDETIDLNNFLVMPGLIDAHVHLRDEGKAYKEDFRSGTASAAAGGMTTVLDMPNNDPVTMSQSSLENRMRTAERSILVNVGFYSEFPMSLDEVDAIAKQGAVAFKLFMVEQIGGLDIDDDHVLLEAFKKAALLKIPTAAHAEDRTMLSNTVYKSKQANQNGIDAYLRAHSEDVEVKAVERLLSLVQRTKVQMHFCHITTQGGLQVVIEGKKLGLPVSCETTPHNLFLTADDLRNIGGIAVTMPPVREKDHVAALWKSIKAGWIDTLGSDHAPHTLKEKEAESIWDVKVGIPGLETTLPLLLTATNQGRLSIAEVVKLMAENPAKIFRLDDRGFLEKGKAGDLTVVDLHRKFKIDASGFLSKAKFSPFDGRSVEGAPVRTFVNGQLVMDEGEIVAKAGTGKVVRRV